MRNHQHPQLLSVCSTRLEHKAIQKYLSKIDILITLMVKPWSWRRRQWEMPVGGSALVVTSVVVLGLVWWVCRSQPACRTGVFLLGGVRGQTGYLQTISCTEVQLLSVSTNLPFWLGENILCLVRPTLFWASVLRRWLEIEELIRTTGWRECNSHKQDNSCSVSLCVLHAACAYFIVRQITCVTTSVRQ